MTLLSKLTEGVSGYKAVEIIEGRCLRRRLNTCNCTSCISVCPGNAITLDRGLITIDSQRCTCCGRCVARCPNAALAIPGYDHDHNMETAVQLDRILFTCRRQGQVLPGEIVLPCLGILSVEDLLFLAVNGPASIYFDTIGCVTCENSQASDTVFVALDYVRKVAGHCFQTQLTVVDDELQMAPLRPRDRRSFLTCMSNGLVSVARMQFEQQPRQTENSAVNSRQVPGKTRRIGKAVAAGADQKKMEELANICFPKLSVNKACTLCPRCSAMCPTGALKLERIDGVKKLTFNGAKCTGCNLCLEFCKENALSLSLAPLQRLPSTG